MSKQFLFVDGDVVAYRAGWHCEKRFYTHDKIPFTRFRTKAEAINAAAELSSKDDPEEGLYLETEALPVESAISAAKVTLDTIQSFRPKAKMLIAFSCHSSKGYRQQIYPDYKANRKEMGKPTHLDAIKQYIIDNYTTRIGIGIEADDILGVWSTAADGVIVTNDKDLKQFAVSIYDYTKNDLTHVTRHAATFNYYNQILSGDSVDNVPGIPGVGSNSKILVGTIGVGDYETLVIDTYIKRCTPLFLQEAGWTSDESTAEVIYASVLHRLIQYTICLTILGSSVAHACLSDLTKQPLRSYSIIDTVLLHYTDCIKDTSIRDKLLRNVENWNILIYSAIRENNLFDDII